MMGCIVLDCIYADENGLPQFYRLPAPRKMKMSSA